FVHPAEATLLFGMGINDPGYLVRSVEKVFVNKQVVIGEKNSKPRVGMVPTDDGLVGILRILNFINMLPGGLGEGHMSAASLGFFSVDAGFHPRLAAFHSTDQHAANFSLHRTMRMLPDLLEHRTIYLDFGFSHSSLSGRRS